MTTKIIFHITLLVMLFAVPASAVIDYSEDFSSNPGWFTDQPSNHYWDDVDEMYYIRSENLHPGYSPSRAAFKRLPEPISDFELRWDVKPTRGDYGCYFGFGVYDSQLSGDGILDGLYIQAGFTNVIGDYNIWALYVNGTGGFTQMGSEALWEPETWYSCMLIYDSSANTVSFEVKNRDTESVIWNTSIPVLGGFTDDVRYLGSSMSDTSIHPSAVAEGYVDNVVMVPEPATLLLLGLSSLVVISRRRA